jgi:hypothetical protein
MSVHNARKKNNCYSTEEHYASVLVLIWLLSFYFSCQRFVCQSLLVFSTSSIQNLAFCNDVMDLKIKS